MYILHSLSVYYIYLFFTCFIINLWFRFFVSFAAVLPGASPVPTSQSTSECVAFKWIFFLLSISPIFVQAMLIMAFSILFIQCSCVSVLRPPKTSISYANHVFFGSVLLVTIIFLLFRFLSSHLTLPSCLATISIQREKSGVCATLF